MAILFEDGYTLSTGDEPLNYARILYSYATGTVTASTAAAGFPASAANNALTYDRWSPTAMPATWQIRPAQITTADCCAIAAHDLGNSSIVATVEVQETFLGPWVEIMSEAITSNRPAMLVFEPRTGYAFRVTLSYNSAEPLLYVVFDDSDDSFDLATGGQIPIIGVIRFGTLMQMTQPVFAGHAPAWLNRQATFDTNMSQSGEWLGRSVRRSGDPLAIEWSHLRASWIRSTWKPFADAIRSEPFFMAWNPLRDPEGTAYAFATDTPVPANMGLRDYMSVSLSGDSYDGE